jgi:hypothetical protein
MYWVKVRGRVLGGSWDICLQLPQNFDYIGTLIFAAGFITFLLGLSWQYVVVSYTFSFFMLTSLQSTPFY